VCFPETIKVSIYPDSYAIAIKRFRNRKGIFKFPVVEGVSVYPLSSTYTMMLKSKPVDSIAQQLNAHVVF
jgi:hypothetical protein